MKYDVQFTNQFKRDFVNVILSLTGCLFMKFVKMYLF